ncbi:MAG TPA: magnesium transporter [Tepidisphaeraceae bacterium]|nr:magnesium transporter [Tepidisphaeraceae bacterium]
MRSDVSLDRPVTAVLSTAAVTLRQNLTVDEALRELRTRPPATRPQAQILYFYVLNDQDQLVGVLSTRALLLSEGSALLCELMTCNLITLSNHETLSDALELFAMHRLLAIPVVDADRHLLGIVEVSLYTDEVFDLAENRQLNEVFQLIGLRLQQQKQGSPLRGFRLRMPWLLSNITGGLLCAALGSLFDATLQRVVLVALFIPVILTLAESVAMQSMTLAIEQAMHRHRDRRILIREILTAILLGLCSGALVAILSLFWRGPWSVSITLALAITLTMILAATLGRLIPAAIHRLRLNPRLASGPITLAIVDVLTITLYLTIATALLRA